MLQVVLASVVSFLATLSLALSVGSQTDSCPSNGVLDAENFTLLAVDKTNTSYQKPLALTIDGILAPTDAESGDSIISKYFSMEGGGITAYAPNGSVVAVSATFDSGNSPVPFIITDNPLFTRPADVYCRLINSGSEGSQFSDELAFHGDSEDFAICRNLDNVPVFIYEADGLNRKSVEFVWQDCHEVHVYMLLVDPR